MQQNLDPLSYTISGNPWLYDSEKSSWHFLSIPKKISTEIKEIFMDSLRPWGSLRIEVTIGSTTWKTSMFFDKKTQEFLLPLKADIRKKENITTDKSVSVVFRVLM